MMTAITDDAARLMELYPRIFHACHTRHVRDESSGRTLSARQASILDHLDDVEPTSLTALAEHMGVTPSTMSLAIDRLERGGYVRRVRDRIDGRRVLLRLSRKGVRIRDKSSVLDASLVRAMLDRLSPAARSEAIAGLAALAAAAQAQMRERSRQGGWARRGKPAVASSPHEPS